MNAISHLHLRRENARARCKGAIRILRNPPARLGVNTLEGRNGRVKARKICGRQRNYSLR